MLGDVDHKARKSTRVTILGYSRTRKKPKHHVRFKAFFDSEWSPSRCCLCNIHHLLALLWLHPHHSRTSRFEYRCLTPKLPVSGRSHCSRILILTCSSASSSALPLLSVRDELHDICASCLSSCLRKFVPWVDIVSSAFLRSSAP